MNKTCPSDLSLFDILDILFDGADLVSLPHIQPMEGNMQKFLLIAFVFGDSKTNGIIYGVRYELPNKVKESTDFPGTYYKVVTDDHAQRKIYRYVPLNMVRKFLKDTDTGDKILPKVLSESEMEDVDRPATGEIWRLDEDGTEVLILENGFGARADGTIVEPWDIIGVCTADKVEFVDD